MENKEIFRKAIEKANKNGFSIKADSLNWDHFTAKPERQGAFSRSLIFSHEFAKAFFGEKEIEFDSCQWCDYYDSPYTYISWRFHLQKMVLEPEPLKYIEKFL